MSKTGRAEVAKPHLGKQYLHMLVFYLIQMFSYIYWKITEMIFLEGALSACSLESCFCAPFGLILLPNLCVHQHLLLS